MQMNSKYNCILFSKFPIQSLAPNAESDMTVLTFTMYLSTQYLILYILTFSLEQQMVRSESYKTNELF